MQRKNCECMCIIFKVKMTWSHLLSSWCGLIVPASTRWPGTLVLFNLHLDFKIDRKKSRQRLTRLAAHIENQILLNNHIIFTSILSSMVCKHKWWIVYNSNRNLILRQSKWTECRRGGTAYANYTWKIETVCAQRGGCMCCSIWRLCVCLHASIYNCWAEITRPQSNIRLIRVNLYLIEHCAAGCTAFTDQLIAQPSNGGYWIHLREPRLHGNYGLCGIHSRCVVYFLFIVIIVVVYSKYAVFAFRRLFYVRVVLCADGIHFFLLQFERFALFVCASLHKFTHYELLA